METLRLVSFNILHGRDPETDAVDVDAFASAVAALDADVLALQEVDRNQARSHHADLTAVAAEAMGAVDHRFVAAMSGAPGATWVAATGEEQPDAAAYGVALLSRLPVSAWTVVRLAPLPVPVPVRFRDQRLPTLVRDEARVAVAARVDTPGGPLSVAGTHLSFIERWNRRQLRTMLRDLAPLDRPLVVVGDLNMDAARAVATSGLRPAAAHPTYPWHDPREQIDHVLLDDPQERLVVTGSEARLLPVSDHRALVVDLQLG